MTIANGTPDPVRTAARDDDCGCGGSSRGSGASMEPLERYAPDHRSRGTAPSPLARNAFYPLKRMEVQHWQAEQDYHRRSRELLTRLSTGTGILCGLEVFLTDEGTLVVEAGVAVDGWG